MFVFGCSDKTASGSDGGTDLGRIDAGQDAGMDGGGQDLGSDMGQDIGGADLGGQDAGGDLGGVDGGTDAGADVGGDDPIIPKKPNQVYSTSGGGVVQSSNHKARINIGAPQPYGSSESETKKVKMGPNPGP